MKWYMVTTADDFELPVAMFARVREVVDFVGLKYLCNVYACIKRGVKTRSGYKIERVEIEE